MVVGMQAVNFLIILFVSCIEFTIFYYVLMWMWDECFQKYVIPPFNLSNGIIPADANNTWYQLQQQFISEIDVVLRTMIPFVFVITVVLAAAVIIYREQAESKEEYYYYGGGA